MIAEPTAAPAALTGRPATSRLSWYAPRLDVMRLAAFLLVFAGHNVTFSTLLPASLGERFSPPVEALGVIVFFVLSAYLIGRLLLIEHAADDRIAMPRYWARRILRIWPLYFFVVLGVFAAAPLLRSIGDPSFVPRGAQLPWSLTFLENWAAGPLDFGTTYLTVLWTVCVEEQVYLLFPLILLLPARAMRMLLLAMVAIGPLSCLMITAQAVPLPAVWNFTTSHFDSFGLGLLAALAASGRLLPGRWDAARRRAGTPAGIAALVGATVLYVAIGMVAGPAMFKGYGTALAYPAASLLALGWVLACSGSHPLTSSAARWSGWLGRRGYGLYVWHWPILLALIQIPVLTADTQRLAVWAIPISLALTVLVSIASYRFLEEPFLRLRVRFQAVHTIAPDAPATPGADDAAPPPERTPARPAPAAVPEHA